jgi:hypothetical protein
MLNLRSSDRLRPLFRCLVLGALGSSVACGDGSASALDETGATHADTGVGASSDDGVGVVDDVTGTPGDAGETSNATDSSGGAASAVGETTHGDDGATTSASDGDTSSDADGTTSAGDGTSSDDAAPSDDDGTSSDDDGTSSDDGGTSSDDDGSSDDGVDPPAQLYLETFDGDLGDPWPAPWMVLGTAVIESELEAGRARLRGQSTQVARMGLAGIEAIDIDATVVVAFDDFAQQGIGFYARQNGGALQQTNPHGQGYCMYLEGQGQPTLGIWREQDGIEETLALAVDPLPGGVAPGALVVMRLQVQQAGDHTQLRTKVWPFGTSEPVGWAVDIVDDTAVLQDVAGAFAFDVYNYGAAGDAYLDAATITEL